MRVYVLRMCVCVRICCTGCPATTVHCPQGPHKFAAESVNAGYYEVIGTLQNNGTITEMNTISMGDSVGTGAKTHDTCRIGEATACLTWMSHGFCK